jgi:hypothetical protein
MAQARPASPDPAQRLTFINEVVYRLQDGLGVTIKYVTWPGDELADWHSATRTFEVAADAAVDDQVWAYMELILLLTVGPDACAGARQTPILHLVPEPVDDTIQQPG